MIEDCVETVEQCEEEAEKRRLAREERLISLGFELPTEEERKQNLALNIALLKWPD
jgi:hypothetical protein